jgi:hypothetical protein
VGDARIGFVFAAGLSNDWQTKAGNETARYLYDSITKNNDYVQYMIKL